MKLNFGKAPIGHTFPGAPAEDAASPASAPPRATAPGTTTLPTAATTPTPAPARTCPDAGPRTGSGQDSEPSPSTGP